MWLIATEVLYQAPAMNVPEFISDNSRCCSNLLGIAVKHIAVATRRYFCFPFGSLNWNLTVQVGFVSWSLKMTRRTLKSLLFPRIDNLYRVFFFLPLMAFSNTNCKNCDLHLLLAWTGGKTKRFNPPVPRLNRTKRGENFPFGLAGIFPC